MPLTTRYVGRRSWGDKKMADSIFALHDVDDVAGASDGRSRLGGYLAGNTRRFRDVDGALTESSAEFTAAAFVTATPPIMLPPYVSMHPRVVRATPRWDDERRCALMIDLATPIAGALVRHLPLRTAGWVRDVDNGRYVPQGTNDRLTAYGRITVQVPVPVELLPDPVYTDMGVADVDIAKRALRALCTHANSVLTHLITALDRLEDPGENRETVGHGADITSGETDG